MSELYSFFNKDANSKIRENILNQKFIYDLKLSSAIYGYELQIYLPEIDKHGYDIIIDNEESIRKFQLKTRLRTAKTSSWSIHRGLLRPKFYNCEKLGFLPDPEHVGLEGGIVLMEVEINDNNLEVGYFYTDIFIILCFRLGIMRYDINTQKRADMFVENLTIGHSHSRIKIGKSMFVKAKSPVQLLSLMGYYSQYSDAWLCNLFEYLKVENKFPRVDTSIPQETRIQVITEELRSLISGRIKF